MPGAQDEFFKEVEGQMTTGDRGEQIAGQYMEKLGFRIIRFNYRCRYGEIDLVLESREYIVFLEVKLRKNDYFATGAEAVNRRKQLKLRRVAEFYLQYNQTNLNPRFDVLEIYAPDGLKAPMRFNHIENAF